MHTATSRRSHGSWKRSARADIRSFPLAAWVYRLGNIQTLGKGAECLGARLPAKTRDGVSTRNVYPLMGVAAGLPRKRQKNRASQSGGDRKARGIFELSTTVGLRRTSAPICTRNRDRNLFGLTKNKLTNCQLPAMQVA